MILQKLEYADIFQDSLIIESSKEQHLFEIAILSLHKLKVSINSLKKNLTRLKLLNMEVL